MKKSNPLNIKVIEIFVYLCLYIYLYLLNKIKKKTLEDNYKKIDDFLITNENSFLYTFFVENEISKTKKFWKYNRNNELIDKNDKKFKRKKNPEISIIITVYNQENCLFKALRSVQNQSIKNIEIIIVDDNSSDNSISIISKYQEEDDRIILLKHMYNYGTMKSRSDAVKLAKGKYITIIDGDDGLATRDILFNCFNIAEIAKLDVIEFGYANFFNQNYKNMGNNLLPIENLNNRIIYQPELKFKFIKITEKIELWYYLNRQIWAKFIKNDIFKKVLEFIGPKYTEDNIIIYEDTIMSIALFIIAKSYYYLKETGYYRSNFECLKSKSNNTKKKCGNNNCIINKNFDSFKYLNFMLERLNSSEFEMKLIYHELFTIDYHFNLCKKINNNYKYVYKFLNNLISKFNLTKQQFDRIMIFKKCFITKKK